MHSAWGRSEVASTMTKDSFVHYTLHMPPIISWMKVSDCTYIHTCTVYSWMCTLIARKCPTTSIPVHSTDYFVNEIFQTVHTHTHAPFIREFVRWLQNLSDYIYTLRMPGLISWMKFSRLYKQKHTHMHHLFVNVEFDWQSGDIYTIHMPPIISWMKWYI